MTTTTETATATTTEVQKERKRSFKVQLDDGEKQYGRYNGESPYQAANKALSEIIRNRVKANQDTSSELTFFLIESTKGSNKKMHQYTGRRVKLDAPVSYTVNTYNEDKTQVLKSQTITKEYKNILRKVKKTVEEAPVQPTVPTAN